MVALDRPYSIWQSEAPLKSSWCSASLPKAFLLLPNTLIMLFKNSITVMLPHPRNWTFKILNSVTLKVNYELPEDYLSNDRNMLECLEVF
jgi:hypothetical protein